MQDISNTSKEETSLLPDPTVSENDDPLGPADHAHLFETINVLLAGFVALLLIAGLCSSVASVQVLDGAIPEFELNTWRFAFQIIVPIPFMIWHKSSLYIPRGKWFAVLAITLLYVGYNLCYYTAATYVPAGTLKGLNDTYIILISVVLTVCIKEERKPHVYVSALIGLVGVFCLTQPGNTGKKSEMPATLFNWTSPCKISGNISDSQTLPQTGSTSPGNEWFGYVLLLVSGICDTGTSRLLAIYIPEMCCFARTFWLGIVGTSVCLVFSVSLETLALPSNPLCIGLLILHCFGTSIHTSLMSRCAEYIPKHVFIIERSLQFVVLIILQYTILSGIQPGHGNWVEILGAVATFVSGIVGPVWAVVREKI